MSLTKTTVTLADSVYQFSSEQALWTIVKNGDDAGLFIADCNTYVSEVFINLDGTDERLPVLYSYDNFAETYKSLLEEMYRSSTRSRTQ